jgi:hypothetical protein
MDNQDKDITEAITNKKDNEQGNLLNLRITVHSDTKSDPKPKSGNLNA